MNVLEKIITLTKQRGFVFPAGEIYGGTRSAFDYGPLGTELKNNIKNEWWKTVVQNNSNVVGLDSSIILPTKTWEASGHLSAFTDPLIECSNCHKRFRFDDLQEEFANKNNIENPDSVKLEELPCQNCGMKGKFLEPKNFSGLMKTYLGPVEDESGLHFLRPETAQGIFLNFNNILNTSRQKIPFGIAQIGKSFRNEITPGNFIFRTREFEQMEMEFFVEPGTDEEWHQKWIDKRLNWYTDLGIKKYNLKLFEHPKEKLSHYSKRTVDIEYKFNFQNSEFSELEGIANRTDYDLKVHSKASGAKLEFFDPVNNKRYTPFVIEPSAGLTRALMAFLIDAYEVDEAKTADGKLESRTVLKLDKRLSPYKIAVLPLSKKDELIEPASKIADTLRKKYIVDFDTTQAIGRRYRRQDEIGTPYCITYDFDSLSDQKVTVRDRDTMEQVRISISQINDYFKDKL